MRGRGDCKTARVMDGLWGWLWHRRWGTERIGHGEDWGQRGPGTCCGGLAPIGGRGEHPNVPGETTTWQPRVPLALNPWASSPFGLQPPWPRAPWASPPRGLEGAEAAASPAAPELPGEGHRARGPRGSGGGGGCEAVKIAAEEKEEKEERRRGGEELS